MTNIKIINLSKSYPPFYAYLADTFFLKLIGLMFQKTIHNRPGLLLADRYESKINSSIHMLFMNFDICAIWMNKNKQVVDVKLAKKWHLAYFPRAAAQYVLELDSTNYSQFTIGDQLQFDYEV